MSRQIFSLKFVDLRVANEASSIVQANFLPRFDDIRVAIEASSIVQANFLPWFDDLRVANVVSATGYCLPLWAIITSVTTSHVFTACN